MGKKFKWDMFVTSFIPLWISIIVIDVWEIVNNFVKDWDPKDTAISNFKNLSINNALLWITILIVGVLVVNSLLGIKHFIKARNAAINKHKGIVRLARRANKLTSEFLLAYILPMIAFNFGDAKYIVLFIIYFTVLAILCIRNNNVYTNIYLEFLGYKMYDCDIECSVLNSTHVYKNSLIISPVELTTEIDNEVSYWDFENYIYIVLKG